MSPETAILGALTCSAGGGYSRRTFLNEKKEKAVEHGCR